MQSPQKLQQRLDELLGPPGPDSDPLELVLRTVVQTTAPMVQGVIAQYTDEQLDAGLEGVALFFLKIRSDDAELTADFLGELAAINSAAYEAAQTVDSSATEDPTPALPPAPPPAPGASVAPDPAPAGPPVSVAPDPTLASPPATSPSSPSEPAPSSSDTSPPGSTPGSIETGSMSSGSNEPAPAPSNPAPPWGG